MPCVENMFLPLSQIMSYCYLNKRNNFTKKRDIDEWLKLILRTTKSGLEWM